MNPAPVMAPAPPMAISSPSADGGTFDGTASGRCSPDNSNVTATFQPNGAGTSPTINGSVTVTGSTWSATFNMTGVGATTNGFLKAVNTSNNNAEAHRSSLVWNPTAPTPTPGGTVIHPVSKS